MAKAKNSGAAQTAKDFIAKLESLKTKADLEKVVRFYRDLDDKNNKFLGVAWGKIFKLAKEYTDLPVKELEILLKNEYYEVRMGAVSIMDFKARNRKITEGEKKALYDLYIKNHNRVNNWDLVDRSAVWVVGGWLVNQSRKPLYTLAKSKNVWERRTAIVATHFFIKQGDIDDTFKIAALLLSDDHDLMQKAVGSWVREAGKRDERKLIAFLDEHSQKMPGTMLRNAVEKLDKKRKENYLKK